jgi:hypothetical protein
MSSDMRFAVIIVISFLTLFSGVALMMNAFTKYQCNNYKRVTSQEVRYVAFDTCYVKTPRGWMRWDEYIARSVTNES